MPDRFSSFNPEQQGQLVRAAGRSRRWLFGVLICAVLGMMVGVYGYVKNHDDLVRKSTSTARCVAQVQRRTVSVVDEERTALTRFLHQASQVSEEATKLPPGSPQLAKLRLQYAKNLQSLEASLAPAHIVPPAC